ncbi:NAD binding domain of 6-phosphogluconate dehydrogenase [Pigmentiphaga humi]|uniref:NAD binding domain of 6-phosphogluconate dehydrogenase n=1 Tax=Pigmentiphaga humi TaxID=2478468 RepID=A0A3P4AVR3_9BURK|nr:NAD(P)-dependent oxidoreductase [Pigmentiphaga humi]VCU68129.1 NAD binding domain of 6-phosphogluconate dehydrogenase [Pigmentiphaga humi]
MTSPTLAILHPGAMGAAVGASLRAAGRRVVWASAGRSAATVQRAQAAGLEDLGTLEAAVRAADIVFSICPPHNAVDLARTVAGLGFRGIYADANAVSPSTAQEIRAVAEGAGARFLDGGIIGLPPRKPGTTRLFLAGPDAAATAALFEGGLLHAVALDGPPGSASALKICFAAWSKGSTALLGAIRALARHEGAEQALLAEWERTNPGLVARSEEIAQKAEKAWRWVGEMEEIAATFRQAGLPDGFHLAAADIYTRLQPYKDAEQAPPMDGVVERLLK